MKITKILSSIAVSLVFFSLNAQLTKVRTAAGVLEGVSSSGITIFKGVPFAAPPVNDLRWKAPQPVRAWDGVRKADHFGPSAMQAPIFGDMNFRCNGTSEDCLYLNVWTPAKTANEKLPVLVYFYGGGFLAGDGSEYRYDGESMARRGIVSVTVNYRLGIFGFLALPELSKESPYHASGNYGLLDQNAALKWVQENITQFGGDPKRVTIAGESAGSVSVSCQMASPLSKNIIAGAIGESGALINPVRSAVPLAEAEKEGLDFVKSIGASSLDKLRAMSAKDLLDAQSKKAGMPAFPVVVDHYFLTKTPVEVYEANEQAQVPLLAGWNSEESNYKDIMGDLEPTPENYKAAIEKLYKEKSPEALKYYPGSTIEEVKKSGTKLAGDRFLAYSTWKWMDLCSQSKNQVFTYYFEKARPAMRTEMGNAVAGLAGGVISNPDKKAAPQPLHTGAVHSAEIEYALGNLPTNRVYDWQPEDYKVSAIMEAYFANFIKTGNPNGIGLPEWKSFSHESGNRQMHLNVNSQSQELDLAPYLWLDKLYR